MKLRVLHGTLKRRNGIDAGIAVDVHGKRFVIGSASDCKMRCPNPSISPYHCEIIREQDSYCVRDLDSATGTFVNGEPLTELRTLKDGDHLRVGRLEFEVVLEKTTPLPPPVSSRPADSVGDNISEMLVAADQEDRAQRFEDPAKRRFVAHEPPAAEQAPPVIEKKKPVLPAKKPPMKLPPAPKIVTDSTVEAAEEVLKKFFERPKK